MNGEDILFAMTSLGFENYGEALKIYLARYREVSARLLREHFQNRSLMPCPYSHKLRQESTANLQHLLQQPRNPSLCSKSLSLQIRRHYTRANRSSIRMHIQPSPPRPRIQCLSRQAPRDRLARRGAQDEHMKHYFTILCMARHRHKTVDWTRNL